MRFTDLGLTLLICAFTLLIGRHLAALGAGQPPVQHAAPDRVPAAAPPRTAAAPAPRPATTGAHSTPPGARGAFIPNITRTATWPLPR